MRVRNILLILFILVLGLAGCGEKIVENPVINVDGSYAIGGGDFAIAVDLKGGEFVSVEGGGISSEDYIFAGETLTLKSSYLDRLDPGYHTFVFKTNLKETEFTVRVEKVATVAPEISFPAGKNYYTEGIDSGLSAEITPRDAKLERVEINGAVLDNSEYSYASGVLTVGSGAFAGFNPGLENELKVVTPAGSATAGFVINDKPVIAGKEDFIKLPGENIFGENFAVLVSDEIGDLTIKISLKSGDGVLTDHGDGTFDYAPAGIGAGEAVITLAVTDSYQARAEKDITLIYKTVNPILVTEHQYLLNSGADLVFDVDIKGGETLDFSVEFEAIEGEGVTEADYNFSAGKITIFSAYLDALGPGIQTFTLKTTAGATAFIVRLGDNPDVTLISESNVVNEGQPASVSFSVDLHGAEFFGLFHDDVELLAGSDYEFAGNELTIRNDAVVNRGFGTITFCLKSDSGLTFFEVIYNDAPTIKDKTDFIKLPGEAVAGENFAGLAINAVGILSYEIDLKSGRGVLTDHGDGTFDFTPDGVYAGVAEILFKVTDSYGLDAEREISLIYKEVNPHIYDAGGEKSVDKKDYFTDVVMTVDTYGGESDNLYYEMLDILVEGASIGAENYVFNTDESKRHFSIKADYLRSLPVGVHVFTLVTEAGRGDFIIEIKDSRPVEVDGDYFEYIQTVSGDIAVTVIPHDNDVTSDSFSVDGLEFQAGAAFGYKDNALTVYAGFLDALDPAVYRIKINGIEMIAIAVKRPAAPDVEITEISIALSGISGDIVIHVELYGLEAETLLYADGEAVASGDYAFSENELFIAREFLAAREYGTVMFTVANSNGEDSFRINISDKPAAKPGSQNVTKFTNETIANEAFRVTATSPWTLEAFEFVSAAYYDYAETIAGPGKAGVLSPDGKSVGGAFGMITIDDEAKGFSVERAPGWFGVIVFSYRAYDDAGIASDEITMDIVYMQRTPNIGEKDLKIYNRADDNDIVYTLITAPENDFPIYKIYQTDYELVQDADYIVGEKSGAHQYFTIKNTFLSTLSDGENFLTLHTEGGKVDFIVTVTRPLAADTPAAEFDAGAPGDANFILEGFPLSVVSVSDDGGALAASDYGFENGVLTIKAAYLEGKPYGPFKIFVNNGQGLLELEINIVDSRNPEVLIEEAEYRRASLAALEIGLLLYDKEILALKHEDENIEKRHYHYASNKLVIACEYLETISDKDAIEIVIVTSAGDLRLTIIVTETTSLPEVEQISSGFAIDFLNDVVFAVCLNGNTFAKVTYLGADLTESEDFLYDEETSSLTIKGRFLARVYRFDAEFASLTLITEQDNNIGFPVAYDKPRHRVLNGGFETGDLYGWNSFQIWKNEPEMIAWTDDRVVSGGYFDQYFSYFRDGDYNLGIYGGAISKDSGQERMGHLRSSDFILGGSGWISFKLGGGADPAFAYVSVRRSADNFEVARFANPNFELGDPEKEARLFQYYFDLSTVAAIGESLYFVISDTASNEWCVLSADSFFAYYEEAPATDNGDIAVNIVPEIQNIETAGNEIKNGDFSDGLNHWTDANGAFTIDGSGFARSDGKTGDGDTGVLRSSAFAITANKYLRFEWAGGLKYDKQIFVSVKEVGTNIEVLRIVRRDNLADKSNEFFDNHILDLSGLDESKLYYLEFADNAKSGWGVSFFKDIRLISEEEYNGIATGDRAVLIPGIETEFAYSMPYQR